MATHDDANGFYDRSLGSVVFGQSLEDPNQLLSASAGKSKLDAIYDASGNLVNLVVSRDGACSDHGQKCIQRYDYDWDEVGRLVRVRRWDYVSIPDDEPRYPDLPK